MSFSDMIERFRRLWREDEDSIFYINGPQTLPPPLSEEEEYECIRNLGNDIGARNELIEHNLRLVYGPSEVCDQPTRTLMLEQEGK